MAARDDTQQQLGMILRVKSQDGESAIYDPDVVMRPEGIIPASSAEHAG